MRAETVIVAEVERLRWRMRKGKAKNARRSVDRIRKLMHLFKGEHGHPTTGVPSRKVCGRRCTTSTGYHVMSVALQEAGRE